MTRMSARALAVARPVIRGLTVLNLVYITGLAVLLGISFLLAGWPERPLGFDLSHAHPQIGNGLRAIVVIGIAAALVVHSILRRLQAIVETVCSGDPFIAENARRLDAIAWRVAALEVSRLLVAAIASAVWEPGRLGGFSIAPWFAVLMLFVLSGVFAQGTRMRADLEGTV
ncbi:MAG TPA: DUF2975 domain-containing protein [Dokdonella sp.]